MYAGSYKAKPLMDTRMALYCNNNSVIYLKSDIQKSSIDYKCIYRQVIINHILLDINSRTLLVEYGTVKSDQY